MTWDIAGRVALINAATIDEEGGRRGKRERKRAYKVYLLFVFHSFYLQPIDSNSNNLRRGLPSSVLFSTESATMRGGGIYSFLSF